MITVTTADSLSLKDLGAYKEPVQICDGGGKVLGVFVPAQGQMRRKVRTPEEEAALLADLERRAKDPGPYCTFREAFEHLLSLTSDPTEQAMLREQIERFAEGERCDTLSR